MTRIMVRVAAVRCSGDAGSALAIALMFLMLFGLYVGSVLQFAATGQRTTISVRSEAVDTYAGGGALDAAINEIRTSLTTGAESGGTTTCFTLPAGALDNPTPVAVTCQPRTGSGVTLGGSSANQPAQAVLALSADAAEGVGVAAATTLPTDGGVLANKLVNVPANATLTSTGSIRAGTCQVTGTSTPACSVAPAGTAVDPSWSGPDNSSTPLVGTLPACAGLVTLSPGIYRSAAALQTVLNCPSAVVWLKPGGAGSTGTYFFDFKDTGTHELTLGAGSVVVGGTPKGWTPGTTAAAAVPYPTAAAPGASACDTSAAGVDLVFSGDSRLNVTGGRAQFCALSTSSAAQHIVLRGSTGTTVDSSGSSGAAGSSEIAVPGARAWVNANQGAVVDGVGAYVKMPNRNDPSSKLLVGPVSSSLVPSDATSVSVTVAVTESMSGTGNTTLAARPGDGSATRPAILLRDCPVATPCSGGATGLWATDQPAVTTGLTSAQVNGMSFEITVNNPNNSPVELWIDGVTVVVTYALPVAAVSGTTVAGPYVTGAAGTTALLKSSGAAVLALHGTVYAPRSVLDLAATNVPYTVVDRGVVVRHLRSAMTPAAGFAGPLISVPALGTAKRAVLLTAVDGAGTRLARADVTFADTAGTGNGPIPTVREWSIR